MTMKEAVSSVFSQYVGFSGRARRSEYWYFALFNIIASAVISIIAGALKTLTGVELLGDLLVSVWELAIILPNLAVSMRRLHDIGKSGWWLLIAVIPVVGAILLLIWDCKDSQPGTNAYGPNPKGI